MKYCNLIFKTVLLFLAFTVLFSLTGCQKESVNDPMENNISGGNQTKSNEIILDYRNDAYFFYLSDSNHSLMRCTVDGVCSYACLDPLCPHDDTCELSNVDNVFQTNGQYIAFTKYSDEGQDGTSSTSVWAYEIETGKTTEVYESSHSANILQCVSITDKYVFFNESVYDKDPESNTSLLGNQIWRYDLKSGNLKHASEEKTSTEQYIDSYDANTVRWRDGYDTDPDYSNKRDSDSKTSLCSSIYYGDENYSFDYQLEDVGEKLPRISLYRQNRKTGEKNTICTDISGSAFPLRGKTVFVHKADQKMLMVTDNDSGEESAICTSPDGYYFFTLTSMAFQRLQEDKYMAFSLYPDGKTTTCEKLLIVNVEDQTAVVSNPDTVKG